jgi:hypothetical protein
MRKIGLLCLALVLALGTLGVGYAMWSDEVTIEGTVDTGTLRLGIFRAVVERIEQDKPVATVDLSFEGPILEKEFAGFGRRWAYEKLVVALNNTFPCLTVDIAFYLACVGSIPLHITAVNISDPSGELIFERTSLPGASPIVGYFYLAGGDPGEEIINVVVGGLPIGQQMHWCDWYKADLILHVKQPAEQNHEYNFVVEVIGEQWAK